MAFYPLALLAADNLLDALGERAAALEVRSPLFFGRPLALFALAYAALMAIQLIITFITAPLAGLYSLVSLAFSLLNYFLFFGRTLIDEIRNQMRIAQNKRNWRNRNR